MADTGTAAGGGVRVKPWSPQVVGGIAVAALVLAIVAVGLVFAAFFLTSHKTYTATSFVLKSESGNLAAQSFVYEGTTTDGTADVIIGLNNKTGAAASTIDLGKSTYNNMMIYCTVQVECRSTSNRGVFQMQFGILNSGSSTTIVSPLNFNEAVPLLAPLGPGGPVTCSASVSGSRHLLITVTGAAGVTLGWRAVGDLQFASMP